MFMCLKISVIVIPEYLHKAFDIRESLRVLNALTVLHIQALLFVIRDEAFWASVLVVSCFAEMYAI